MQATTTSDLNVPAAGLLGAPAGELVLQVCGAEHDGRVLRLSAAKCLIGSAAGCTLRLRARGIRPVHALIMRGPEGALVRCWSADAQLNGRGFSEAPLAVGDELQIGPARLSVTALGKESSAPAPHGPCYESEPPPAVSAAAAPDDVLNQQLARTIEQLREELDASARRRTLEQQSFARQRASWEEETEQRHAAALEQLRLQQQAQQERAVAEATNELRASLERKLAVAQQQQATSVQEVQTLKRALEAKTRNEEQARRTTAEQIEQLTTTFDLVRRERDELFDRLHSNSAAVESQAGNWQAQIDDIRRQAQLQINEAQAAAQKEIARVREEFTSRERQLDETLIAQSSGEMQRSAADCERILRLTAEVESLRAETRLAAANLQQQQDGFTQARKRLEAEIAELTAKLQQAGETLHEARENSGQLQAAVLAEAEQARDQRDAVREQMLRQQQDWTEFRSRLEAAAAAEREMAQTRYDALQADVANSEQTQARLTEECDSLRNQVQRLQTELEQSQEALFATEHGLNQRLQQMTVSMDQLKADSNSSPVGFEQERAGWEQERNALAQCVAELQREISALAAQLQSAGEAKTPVAEDVNRHAAVAAQLRAAEEQVSHWQAAAEQAKQHAEELSAAVVRFQSQEQAWQLEREQLDLLQQTSTDRLQQLESAISELQQQLDEAQRAVAVTCPPPAERAAAVEPVADFGCTINVNNQDLAALREQAQLMPPAGDFTSTINVNNQELAALCEQANEPFPDLLTPRELLSADQREAFQAREAALQEQADELAAQQAELEEQQALVARQRIELEQFQASLVELERSLTVRAEAMLQQPAFGGASENANCQEFSEQFYGGEPERESNPLSESEAFAAMADHVASLASYAPESIIHSPQALAPTGDEATAIPAALESRLDNHSCTPPVEEDNQEESFIIPARTTEEPVVDEPLCFRVAGEIALEDPADVAAEVQEYAQPNDAANESEAPESFGRSSDEYARSAIHGPLQSEETDSELDARMARVMRQENSDWKTPAASNGEGGGSEAEVQAPRKSDAVNNVLDRLREAGLWKGEGTAKADQLPSSAPPVNTSEPAMRRLSEAGPIVGDVAEREPRAVSSFEERDEQAEHDRQEESPRQEDDLTLIARSHTPPATLLDSTPNNDDSEDSIESYMSRLMQRLRPDANEPPAPHKTTGAPKHQPIVAAAAPIAVAPPKPVETKPLTSLEELAPRSQAPEQSSNLAAMRELANSAARGAIQRHQHQHQRKSVNLRTLNTIMALLVGAGLVYYWQLSGSWVALGGAALSLLWAIASSSVAMLQSIALRRPKQATEEQEQAAD